MPLILPKSNFDLPAHFQPPPPPPKKKHPKPTPGLQQRYENQWRFHHPLQILHCFPHQSPAMWQGIRMPPLNTDAQTAHNDTRSIAPARQMTLPITRPYVVEILKSTLTALHRDHTKFNTHSFRIGKASDLSEGGASNTQIVLVGR